MQKVEHLQSKFNENEWFKTRVNLKSLLAAFMVGWVDGLKAVWKKDYSNKKEGHTFQILFYSVPDLAAILHW